MLGQVGIDPSLRRGREQVKLSGSQGTEPILLREGGWAFARVRLTYRPSWGGKFPGSLGLDLLLLV